jgi:hypothetical protein
VSSEKRRPRHVLIALGAPLSSRHRLPYRRFCIYYGYTCAP